ncbi:MAG: DUF3383 family protein, partial [Fusobacteriaceae bacterium]
MGRIVTVSVIDLTRPVEQRGLKTVALFDFTTDLPVAKIQDVKELTAGTALYKSASKYFANGGSTLIVAGKAVVTAEEIGEFMASVLDTNDYYGVLAIVDKAKQAEQYETILEFVEGNKLLAVLEVNGEREEVEVFGLTNSDRLVTFANKATESAHIGSAVAGMCFPMDEGSITWGNKAVTGVPVSGYTLTEESALLEANINYITKEKGFIITQFGKTTSGSNADITRSKDWLTNRCAESLTSSLVNNKKIPFNASGMAMISSSLNQVGVQAVSMG